MRPPFMQNTHNFTLIETILWENGEYFLLDLHMKRLKKSAGCFAYACDRAPINKALENSAASFDPAEKYRVRLLLERSGKSRIRSDILDTPDTYPVKIAVSDKRTDKNDIFLYHKTTNRAFYDQELAKYRAKGFFDVIFMNQNGEVTEGAVTNIIARKGNDYWTPPVSSGILAGVYREYLLKTQNPPLKEKVLSMEDLKKADGLFLINSVRKTIPAELNP